VTVELSPRRRKEVINALRRGTVPHNGLDVLAVGLDRFATAIDAELETVAAGNGAFKAVRGEYGAGKTFFARWVAERAKRRGMAVAEVQISETETPLHRLETVYRRICESLQTAELPASALRAVLDAWLFMLDQESGDDAEAVLERRLAAVSRTTPAFAAALRGYRAALHRADAATAEGLVAWLGGQPQVAAAVRRAAGVRGELDHFGAFGFLQGLLTVLRDSGHPGLLVVLDEVETLQRARSDVRDKALNALRQLIDEVDSGRFPGLYLLMTGTPAFFDGAQGAQRLAPLAQRLATDFTAGARWDNPRAVQLRLPGFTTESLRELGGRVRDIFAADADDPHRIAHTVDDEYVADFGAALTGRLGGKVGVVPRLFLKKLIGEVLDRVDQYPDFDPRSDYALTLVPAEMTEVEHNVASADEVALDLP
jgi:hypothetical protein